MTTTAPAVVFQAHPQARSVGYALFAGYLVFYAAALLTMHRVWGFDLAAPLLILAVLGGGFSLAAWLLTIGSTALPYPVAEPRKESVALVLYLIPLTAYITWGDGIVRRVAPADPGNAVAVVIGKLLFFVIIPGAMLCALAGYRIRDLAPISFRKRDGLVLFGMSVLLLGFQAVFGRGLHDLRQARLPPSTLIFGSAIAFAWLALEAGVVEEFFFRVLLQSRLSGALRSELGAVILMAVVFGLAHAPGLYLRTGMTQEGLPPHPPLVLAIGYSIVITSVAGLFLGVLWARTRNFLLVVLVHAMADLLPDLLPTLHSLRTLQ